MNDPTAELRVENDRLRKRLRALTEHVQVNEEKLRRFQAREMGLLTANTLPAFLRALVVDMRAHFQLDSVSLALMDRDHVLRHLLLNGGASLGGGDGILFVDCLERFCPAYRGLREPYLGPYRPSIHGALFSRDSRLASVALLPLVRKQSMVGCINLGSREDRRFTPNHDTFFIHRLATVSAVCLENTVNRERLLLSGLTDILTGLHNRRYIQRRLPEEMARARRHSQPLSCLYLDVDHFKRVNDAHGHAAGDRVLREFARRMRSLLRANDVAARYGGEEFTVLLPHARIEDSVELADRIRTAVAARPVTLESGVDVAITVSIGVAEARPGIADLDLHALGDDLLSNADSALYRAKNAGRNQVVHFA